MGGYRSLRYTDRRFSLADNTTHAMGNVVHRVHATYFFSKCNNCDQNSKGEVQQVLGLTTTITLHTLNGEMFI